MDRRRFVHRLPVITTGVWVGASTVSLAGCGGIAYLAPAPGPVPEELLVRAASVPPEGALVQRPDMERPVYVRRSADGAYTALLLRCTHRGCQPDPVGDRLVCPCHGSEYDLAGNVLEGPAPRALTRYPVLVQGGDLVITMREGAR